MLIVDDVTQNQSKWNQASFFLFFFQFLIFFFYFFPG
jgi:hypothetical protein